MIEALFYKSYYSYLNGDLEQTKIYYAILKEEFRANGDKNALNFYQLRLLKKVKIALESGNLSEEVWLPANTLNNIVKVNKDKPDRTHKQLVKDIHNSFNQLEKILIANKNFQIYNIEHPCAHLGRIDMVYIDDIYIYPVEVKPALGEHDIVGQILKYEKALRMKLHIKLWKDVQPVTICQGYSEYAINELKKRKVKTIQYQSIKEGLLLKEV